jgi:protein-disulfide isomerase
VPDGPKCKRCGATFATDAKLERHVSKQHGGRHYDPGMRWLLAGAVVVALAMGIYLLQSGDRAPAENALDNYALFGLADDPYMGDPAAGVVVVEFGAPKCSSCAFFHRSALPDLAADYFDTGQAVLYFVQSTPGYEFDYDGGIAQECVYREGGNAAFWSFTDRIYREQSDYTRANVESWLSDQAAASGIDEAALLDCYKDRDTARNVSADWALRGDLGVTGTPTFFVYSPTGPAIKVQAGELTSVLEDRVGRLRAEA